MPRNLNDYSPSIDEVIVTGTWGYDPISYSGFSSPTDSGGAATYGSGYDLGGGGGGTDPLAAGGQLATNQEEMVWVDSGETDPYGAPIYMQVPKSTINATPKTAAEALKDMTDAATKQGLSANTGLRFDQSGTYYVPNPTDLKNAISAAKANFAAAGGMKTPSLSQIISSLTKYAPNLIAALIPGGKEAMGALEIAKSLMSSNKPASEITETDVAPLTAYITNLTGDAYADLEKSLYNLDTKAQNEFIENWFSTRLDSEGNYIGLPMEAIRAGMDPMTTPVNLTAEINRLYNQNPSANIDEIIVQAHKNLETPASVDINTTKPTSPDLIQTVGPEEVVVTAKKKEEDEVPAEETIQQDTKNKQDTTTGGGGGDGSKEIVDTNQMDNSIRDFLNSLRNRDSLIINEGGGPAGGGTGDFERPAIFGGKLPESTLGDISPRDVNLDWSKYGFGPEASFFMNVPERKKMAGGGRSIFAVKGKGSGRSDEIPARLSDGEYVIDAETVALLGDGSSKAGADRLDQFRVNIRKHKGKNLARGKFSVNAKKPEAYMAGGRK